MKLYTTILLLSTALTRSSATHPKIRSGAISSEVGAIKIDPSNNRGTWEGWGLSLAWLANLFGEDEKLADTFFTMQESVQLVEGHAEMGSLPALGLNIARYNAGGTCGGQRDGLDTFQGVSTDACQYAGEQCKWSGTYDWRRIQTFWMNWHSKDPTNTTSWRWNVDLNQRQMLLNAKERNPNMIFELFSNSPPWWMLYNKDVPGNGGNNLQKWNEGDFAYYLATVAKHYEENFGIQWQSVAPFNEPRGGNFCWWRSPNSQEGCCMDLDQQMRVVSVLREELDKQELQNIKISASDESYIDRATDNWKRTRSKIKSLIYRLNVHGYQGMNSRRDLFHDLAKQDGKKVWMSEYGDCGGWTDPMSCGVGHKKSNGMYMVEMMNADFVWLQMTAWLYWQPMDATDDWGLIRFPYDAEHNWGSKEHWEVKNKYYLHAQFSRHIRPNMKIIHATGSFYDNYIVAAMAPNRLAVVFTRFSGPEEITLDLSAFEGLGGNITCTSWVTEGTDVKGRKKYEKSVGGATIAGGFLKTTLLKWSVKTVEVEWTILP